MARAVRERRAADGEDDVEEDVDDVDLRVDDEGDGDGRGVGAAPFASAARGGGGGGVGRDQLEQDEDVEIEEEGVESEPCEVADGRESARRAVGEVGVDVEEGDADEFREQRAFELWVGGYPGAEISFVEPEAHDFVRYNCRNNKALHGDYQPHEVERKQRRNHHNQNSCKFCCYQRNFRLSKLCIMNDNTRIQGNQSDQEKA